MIGTAWKRRRSIGVLSSRLAAWKCQRTLTRSYKRSNYYELVDCITTVRLLLDDRGRHLREKLGQCVDLLRQLAGVGLVQFGVGDEALATPVGLQSRVDLVEPRFDFLCQFRFLAGEQRLDRFERGLGTFHVGLEVDQVYVRVALLLAGDLRGRDLAQQLVGAV